MSIYCIFFVCLKVWSEWINFQIQNDVSCLYPSLLKTELVFTIIYIIFRIKIINIVY